MCIFRAQLLAQTIPPLFLFWGCTSVFAAAPSTRFEASREAMGGTFTIVVYSNDARRAEPALANALEEAVRLDALLSNYKPASEWSRINREAAAGPMVVSGESAKLLADCLAYSRESEGAFDITVGPLLKTWRFYKGSGRLPHRAEIRAALEKVSYQFLEVDPRANTVRFRKPGVEIDPGGIGKGYAVDRMAAILRSAGVESAFISAAGSSLLGIGHPPEEPRGWKVDVRHPRDGSKTVETVYLKDSSLSTSGAQEKFFEAGGRIYSHIFDPRTGYPAQGRLQVSIVAPRAIDSEAWTKPVFIQGRSWAAQRLPKGLRAYICEDTRELSCAWLQ